MYQNGKITLTICTDGLKRKDSKPWNIIIENPAQTLNSQKDFRKIGYIAFIVKAFPYIFMHLCNNNK